MISDPRPTARIVDPRAGTEKIKAERRCRVCGITYMLNRAHLVPKGQRGDDVDDNIIPLCGSGTVGCHGSMTDYGKANWPSKLCGEPRVVIARLIRQSLSAEEEAYILGKKGADWLDKMYPS